MFNPDLETIQKVGKLQEICNETRQEWISQVSTHRRVETLTKGFRRAKTLGYTGGEQDFITICGLINTKASFN